MGTLCFINFITFLTMFISFCVNFTSDGISRFGVQGETGVGKSLESLFFFFANLSFARSLRNNRTLST